MHNHNEQFFEVGLLDLGLISLGLALSPPSTSLSSDLWCYVSFLNILNSLYLVECLAWWDWPQVDWPGILIQCFDTVGWVIRPVKNRPRYDLKCVWWDVKPYSIQSMSVCVCGDKCLSVCLNVRRVPMSVCVYQCHDIHLSHHACLLDWHPPLMADQLHRPRHLCTSAPVLPQ